MCQIWISPITYNLEGNTGDGTAYHGYWQQDLYRLNENFGSADDLKALATELHNRDMVRRTPAPEALLSCVPDVCST